MFAFSNSDSFDMSSPAEKYQKARYDVLRHASTKHLVAQNEQSMEDWAKTFALTQYVYKSVTNLLDQYGHLYIDTEDRVNEAFKIGDAFILENADVTWEGKWVHTHWKTAAISRQEAERKEHERKERLVIDAQKNLNLELDKLFDIAADDCCFEFSDDSVELACENAPATPGESVSQPEAIATSTLTTPLMHKAMPLASISTPPSFKRKVVSVDTAPGNSSLSVKRSRQNDIDISDCSLPASITSPLAGRSASGSYVPAGTCKGLPFDYRALSEDARTILAVGKPLIRITVLDTLKRAFQGKSLKANVSFVKEMSKILPPCLQCLAARKTCVWFPDRAQCYNCHNTKKCDFGDTFKWLKACSWLPNKEPKELRVIMDSDRVKVTQSRTGIAYSPSPFWYEQRDLVTSVDSSTAGPSSVTVKSSHPSPLFSPSSSYTHSPSKGTNYDDLDYHP